ncbi:CG15452 [Drosophila busckii]|uniref:CG15452 n=1 Tax=Drosophila busckii TaxID=30019 RepID=A0A0M4EKA1_DROBS|nr:uncharacterized protein LOC108606020 [Drosophila busckii]ALC49778.1 CG15452 [Drosophila busckii]
MLRQFQLTAPLKALQLKRCLVCTTATKCSLELPKCLPLPQRRLVSQQSKPKPKRISSLSMAMASGSPKSKRLHSAALMPLDEQRDINGDGAGSKSSLPLPGVKERKHPHYNPLRRRSNVDPARVQYIKDRFKQRDVDSANDSIKPKSQKFVSRTSLHSGRLDKIN